MKYIYLPNSYDYDKIAEEKISDDEFLRLQIKYRESLEKWLLQFLDFKSIDSIIEKSNITIPEIDDINYNFYHKFSFLNSKYIFLRNNIHIERLSKDEIGTVYSAIMNDDVIPNEFIIKTLEKVIFESGEKIFFGTPLDKNETSGKSMVFEFAYNDKVCSIKESKQIHNFCSKMFEALKNTLESQIRIDVNFIIYDGFNNSFKNVKEKEISSFINNDDII